MKKTYVIGIISMILGFILLIPSFISDFMDTLAILLTSLGITIIFVAFFFYFYPRKIKINNNQNSN